ncbi:MarR family transcriptional regulator [Paenibacillus phocaensis]|uniref:MarR family transcriptional regulator n=1 Tax=Paenibacillus phocaensis TaxID=1776378 RepID=UPI00039DE9DD|nr:MarR family transcriptional regulator [Paenibacillus phocaensis]
MDSTDRIKALIYEQVLHYSHLYEQEMELELSELKAWGEARDLPGLPGNLSTVHVLECIGDHEPINHSAVAERMNLSKASITKISTKLLALGYIERIQRNDNRKEVYFRLTPQGNELYKLHEALHQEEERRFMRLLNDFSDRELQTILRFLQGMANQVHERKR